VLALCPVSSGVAIVFRSCLSVHGCGITFRIMQRRLKQPLVLAFALVLSLCGVASGQSPTTWTCSRRTIWVSAIDRNWAQIPDLRADEFEGEFHRKAVKILGVAPNNQKPRVIMLLDASGSVGKDSSQPEAWRLGLALASDLVEARMGGMELALVIFNDKIVEKMDFGSGEEKIALRLRQIAADPEYEKTNVKGRTALWDAAATALGMLGRNGDGVIYAITDGGDNHSIVKQDELRRRLTLSGTRLFSSLITSNSGNRSRPPEEIEGPEALAEVAFETGGAVFGPVVQTNWGLALTGSAVNVDRKITMRAAVTNFYNTILHGYRLEIELPRTQDRWSQWKLNLAKPTRARLKYFQLGFARDIPPCGASDDLF
jgi:hypothetical protein